MRSIKATQNSWGLVAKIFHWVLALLLIWQIFTGFNLHNMEFSPIKIGFIGIHKIIGTIIITIGTHSSGHPNKNIATITIAKIKYLFISKPNKNSVNNVGVPNLAKTAPKKFDAATKTMIRAVISKVLTSAS